MLQRIGSEVGLSVTVRRKDQTASTSFRLVDSEHTDLVKEQQWVERQTDPITSIVTVTDPH